MVARRFIAWFSSLPVYAALAALALPQAAAAEAASSAPPTALTAPSKVVADDDPDTDIDTTRPVADQLPTADARTMRAVFKAWVQFDNGQLGVAAPTVFVPNRRPLETARLSSNFGLRHHPIFRRQRHHNGIDFAAPTGTPIHATADGIVGRAQRLGGYGNYVEIEHGAGIQSRYGHMTSYAVQPGQRVKAGDLIGYVGSTGRSTGPHLHYEVRIAGAPVDPMVFLDAGNTMMAADTPVNAAAMGGPEGR